MAGTVTVTKEFINEPDRHFVGQEITISWTSDSSGNADKLISKMTGWLVFAKTFPSSTAAPSDEYDIKLEDSDGDDVLEGALADRSNSAAEFVPTANSGVSIIRELNGDYTFDVSNAGNAKSGTCVFRIRWK